MTKLVKVKYKGGVGDEIEVNFAGPIVVRFTKGKEVLLDKDLAQQLLDCPDNFVEVKDTKDVKETDKPSVKTSTKEKDEEVVVKEVESGDDK